MQSFDKRYNHQCDIQFMIYSFFTCKNMVFTNKSLLCNWESYLVSQLYWLKGPCNRFQTHKRFKRFEVYKSDVLVLLFWKQNMTLSQSDRFPPWGENNLIGQSDYFPSREGKRSDWFFVVTWSVRNGIANSHWFLTIEWTLKFEWILTDEGNHFRTT